MFMSSGYSAQTRSSATEHRHARSDMFRGGADCPRRLRREPGSAALGVDAQVVDAVEMDEVRARGAVSVAVERRTDALDREARALVANGDRLAGVVHAGDDARVG